MEDSKYKINYKGKLVAEGFKSFIDELGNKLDGLSIEGLVCDVADAEKFEASLIAIAKDTAASEDNKKLAEELDKAFKTYLLGSTQPQPVEQDLNEPLPVYDYKGNVCDKKSVSDIDVLETEDETEASRYEPVYDESGASIISWKKKPKFVFHVSITKDFAVIADTEAEALKILAGEKIGSEISYSNATLKSVN